MGSDAQVIAIGPFSESILSALEYDPSCYLGVPEGATVVTNVFIACTSQSSNELASAFGVETMELGKHHLQPSNADLTQLETVFGSTDLARFQLLATHGFSFYYLPNG